MTPARPNFFAGTYIDRRTEVREEEDWLERCLADPHCQFLLARGTRHLVHREPQPRIAFVCGRHPAVAAAEADGFVLLGWFRERRCVLLSLASEWQDTELPAGSAFEELRPLCPQLDAEEAGLLGYARALALWRARRRYCGVCGGPTIPARAGHSLICAEAECAEEYFPRIDPAIIVLVTAGEQALLGRQASWPTGRYSTIAGFVEPGESLEDAVRREVMEETGVSVLRCQYDSSQPWPFPASLMLGFQAVGTSGAVRIGRELQDARWFSRTEVRGGRITLPPLHSISRRLIEAWLGAQP